MNTKKSMCSYIAFLTVGGQNDKIKRCQLTLSCVCRHCYHRPEIVPLDIFPRQISSSWLINDVLTAVLSGFYLSILELALVAVREVIAGSNCLSRDGAIMADVELFVFCSDHSNILVSPFPSHRGTAFGIWRVRLCPKSSSRSFLIHSQ